MTSKTGPKNWPFAKGHSGDSWKGPKSSVVLKTRTGKNATTHSKLNPDPNDSSSVLQVSRHGRGIKAPEK
ncbi:hypothetical protein TNIN_115811 [Trichonephila inaurata madagascariensis]|uniref:Uncharacterized protein n=1 Tax=Trichonephila inaurata madagascariensis TaxID=2747483 RepID=A0A8X7CE43_9ARAC|nr:hypothetical protein TNIN_115811 [Trichonephila inaurata madagascariensis]